MQDERTSSSEPQFSVSVERSLLPLKPPSRLSLLRQIRALGRAGEACKASPSAIAGTVLFDWCASDFDGLPQSQLPYSKKLSATAPVKRFVQTMRELSLLDGAYWLSSAYAMLTTESDRRQLAMFFTPASLTAGLLKDLQEQGVDFATQSFLDPACGGAAFLAPIALRIREALRKQGCSALEILKHVEGHLYGSDLDGTLCALSKQFLRMALYEEILSSAYVPEFMVHKANSLTDLGTMFLLGRVDVVVCNPPYRKMDAEEVSALRDGYSDVIECQPNLYGLFIALCVRLLREGGYAALVTPTSFLSGQYFGSLRRYLSRNCVIEHIGMVSDSLGVFIDVEQETALTVLRRCSQGQGLDTSAGVSVVSPAGAYESVGRCVLSNTGAVWAIPRTVKDVPIVRAAAGAKSRLADYGYRVRIGAYVWNRDKRPKFKSLRKVPAARVRTAVPLVWSSDICAGGTVRVNDEPRPDGGAAFVDFGERTHTSVVSRPSVVLQRVTSNDQPRRLVAAAVARSVFERFGGFVGENHIVVLEQTSELPALSPSQMSQLLSAEVIDRYFRCISGATNVSAFELNQLVLPDPQTLNSLISAGVTMNDAAARALGV